MREFGNPTERRQVGFDSLPGGEQDDDLFSDVERSEGELESYRNKEKANVILRAGRLKNAWNRCGTWTIYGGWGLAGMKCV